VRERAVNVLGHFGEARLSGFDASHEAVYSGMCSRGPEFVCGGRTPSGFVKLSPSLYSG
jgi:hypothetical protein